MRRGLKMTTASGKLIHVYTVRLRNIEPAIWRRIEVPETYSFWDLHVAIQDAMGWLDYHLHEFELLDRHKQKVCIGIPEVEESECPPEDCGGADAYQDLVGILADSRHPGRRSMIRWLKGHVKNYYPFRPNHFDPEAVVFSDPRERLRRMRE